MQSLHWAIVVLQFLCYQSDYNSCVITYCHQHDKVKYDPIVYVSKDNRITRFIEADYHFFICDDNSQHTLLVQHCLDFHWKWMQENRFVVNKNYVVDGCAANSRLVCHFHMIVASIIMNTKRERFGVLGEVLYELCLNVRKEHTPHLQSLLIFTWRRSNSRGPVQTRTARCSRDPAIRRHATHSIMQVTSTPHFFSGLSTERISQVTLGFIGPQQWCHSCP